MIIGRAQAQKLTRQHTLIQLRTQQMFLSLITRCWNVTLMVESTPMWIMTSL